MDRQSKATAQAAILQRQAVQASVAKERAQAEQAAAAAAAAAAPRQQASFGSPYAPRRDRTPDRYEAPYSGSPDQRRYDAPYRAPYSGTRDRPRYQSPYGSTHYTIGPWGGLWIGL
jgi:hypothetical protein